MLGAIVTLWQQPLAKTKEVLLKAYQFAYEGGDLVYAHYCNIFLFSHTLMMGSSLSDSEQMLARVLSFIKKLKTQDLPTGLETILACLLGKKLINSEEVTEEEKLLIGRHPHNSNYFYSGRTKLYFLFNCYKQAVYAGAKHWQYAQYDLSSYSNPEGYFYYALALMTEHHLERSVVKTIKKIHQKFKLWAKWCPENFLHYLLLIEAEMAKIKNRS